MGIRLQRQASDSAFETNTAMPTSLEFIKVQGLNAACGHMEAIDKAVTDAKGLLLGAKSRLTSTWESRAGDAFNAAFNQLYEQVSNFEDKFKKIKDCLQEVAVEFMDTDESVGQEMDQARIKSGREGNDASSQDPLPVETSGLGAATEALLDDSVHGEKTELFSSMEADNPANLDMTRRTEKPELYSTMEAEYNAVFETARRTEKPWLTSVLEEIINALFTQERLSGKNELFSAMEEATVAALAEAMNRLKEELNSIMEENIPAFLALILLNARPELLSAMEAVIAAVLVELGILAAKPVLISSLMSMLDYQPVFETARKTEKPELFSATEAEYTPVLETANMPERPELVSAMEAEYTPVFETARMTERPELYSTMEAEYTPVFETSRRSYRVGSGSLVLVSIVVYMVDHPTLVLRRDGEGTTLTDTVRAIFSLNEKVVRATVSSTIRSAIETVSSDWIAGENPRIVLKPDMNKTTLNPLVPAFSPRPDSASPLRSAQGSAGQIFGSMETERPAALTARRAGASAAPTIGGSTMEAAQNAVLQDYRNGSPTYRNVQKEILTQQTANIMLDGARACEKADLTAQRIGYSVVDTLAGQKEFLNSETRDKLARTMGNRVYDCMWHQVSYQASRMKLGASVQGAVEAVLAQQP